MSTAPLMGRAARGSRKVAPWRSRDISNRLTRVREDRAWRADTAA